MIRVSIVQFLIHTLCQFEDRPSLINCSIEKIRKLSIVVVFFFPEPVYSSIVECIRQSVGVVTVSDDRLEIPYEVTRSNQDVLGELITVPKLEGRAKFRMAFEVFESARVYQSSYISGDSGMARVRRGLTADMVRLD